MQFEIVAMYTGSISLLDELCGASPFVIDQAYQGVKLWAFIIYAERAAVGRFAAVDLAFV